MKFLFKQILAVSLIIALSACQGSSTETVVIPDYTELSTNELKRLHKKGDIEATFTLGFNHFFNEDTSAKEDVIDTETGLNYLLKAHDNGHMKAHSNLSLIYDRGLFGIPVDHEKANKFNLEGAQRGSHVGKLNYGLHNLFDTKKTTAQVAHDYLFEIASDDQVGGIANEHLAQLYYFGNENFEPNYENARLFAENCVLFGSSAGWCEFILARDFSEGWGGPRDLNRSAKLFIQSGHEGYPAAMWYAGMNALNGIGVEKNETEAFNWVKRAAENDYENAMISLGVMYALGQGTEIDYVKSYESYSQAAERGRPHAIRSMAGMHCDGNGQVKNDEICFSGVFLAMEHGDDQAPLLLKSWFDFSDIEIEEMRKQRPPDEAFWTKKFSWLLEDRVE